MRLSENAGNIGVFAGGARAMNIRTGRLPERDQRAILRMLDAMAGNQNGA